MVTEIVFTKPKKLNNADYVKGDKINVYEPLRKELVDIEKVAKEVKATKEKGE